MKARVLSVSALLVIAGLAGLMGCGGASPTGVSPSPQPTPSSPSTSLSYFGVGQYRLAAHDTDYMRHIADQLTYSNFIGLSFEFDSAGGLVAPTARYLAAMQAFEKSAIMLGQDIWRLPVDRRQRMFDQLKSLVGYEFIDAIVIIDEPYLGGFTPAQLQDIINEGKLAFPNKEYSVNFNPREFNDRNQGPNGPLYDHMLDYVSFDMYPANFEVSCTNEIAWKQKVKEDIDFFQARTTKRLIYIGQGFSRPTCTLTPQMVEWTYEVAAAERVFGLVFWFSEALSTPFTGFSSTPVAEQRIRELGRQVTRR